MKLDKDWRQRCIDYGKSEPDLLKSSFIFSHINRECCACYINDYKKDPEGAFHMIAVRLTVIFPEMGDE
jgi:hypothetical protein